MRLVIIGAGGHGQTVADIAVQTGEFEEIVFLDDRFETEKCPEWIKGSCSDFVKYIDGNTCMYPAFGYNELRMEWEKKLRYEGVALALIVHPTAYISPYASVSKGCVVMPYAIINTGSIVKRGCIVNCHAIIDHGCVIEEGCHIAPGAIVKAENHLPALTKVDSGEIIAVRQFA